MTAKEELVILLVSMVKHWNWTWLQTADGEPIPIEATPIWRFVEAYVEEEHQKMCDDCRRINLEDYEPEHDESRE